MNRLRLLIASALSAATGLGLLLPTAGFGQNPNSVGIGFTKGMYEKCLSVSTTDLAGTAALAAFPDALNDKVFGAPSDPLNEFKLICASQLRKGRCTKQMTDALGEVYKTIAESMLGMGLLPNRPASASKRDPVVIGTVAGGAAGLAKGAMSGHPIMGALGGAYLGNKAGKLYSDSQGTWVPVGTCAYRQALLSRIGAKLQMPPSALMSPLPIDVNSVQSVLDENVNAMHLTLTEAGELRNEIALLVGRLNQIVIVINQ